MAGSFCLSTPCGKQQNDHSLSPLSISPKMWVYVSLIKMESLFHLLNFRWLCGLASANTIQQRRIMLVPNLSLECFILWPSLGTLFLSCEKPSLAYLMMKTHSPVNTYHLRSRDQQTFSIKGQTVKTLGFENRILLPSHIFLFILNLFKNINTILSWGLYRNRGDKYLTGTCLRWRSTNPQR